MSRKRKSNQKSNPKTGASLLSCLNLNAAGVDIGATEIYVAVPGDRDPQPVRCFPTFTEDLHAAAAWLKACHIETVAMESTGVYWIPLFQILEARGFKVFLVNAPPRKECSGTQVRCMRLPVAAVSAFGRAAAGLVSTGGSGLRDSLPAASPRQSGTDGGCARATYAEGPHPDECADPSRAQ